MIIQSSTVQMSAEHQKLEVREQTRSQQGFALELSTARLQVSRLAIGQGLAPGPLQALNATPLTGPSGRPATAGLFHLLPGGIGKTFRLAAEPTEPPPRPSLQSSSARLFQALFEAITGRINRVSEAPSRDDAAATVAPTATGAAPAASPAAPGTLPVVGSQRAITVEVKVSDYYREEECTRFCASGSVETTDGERFDLNLNLEMYRSFESTTEYSLREEVVFTDPLVVNFNGSAAELTEEKYAFDLDVDGETEWISFVNEDSGLLALDANEDGQINDGSELFGAVSGNGFGDLAAFDEDSNGWIDEADSIFADLKIWRKRDGEDQLDSLLDRNVGAIYLGATDTPFDLKDRDNQIQGRVRQSGIYLDEGGGVGSVQQIDMAV